MICDILLLYAHDSELVKNDLLQQLRGIPAHCICIDGPEFAQRSYSQIKLQIVFFSPGFLEFLECRVQEAFEFFCCSDPQATVALFCGGLREGDIFCYHTAPLKSYRSWPKYEYLPDQNDGNAFSPYFLGLFEGCRKDQSKNREHVVIVPDHISKGRSRVYIIFSEVSENIDEIYVELETCSRIQVVPEYLNPYALFFNIPEMVLEIRRLIEIHVKRSGVVLASKILKVVPEDEVLDQNGTRKEYKREKSAEVIRLEEELKAAEDILADLCKEENKRISADSARTISPQENDFDMCFLEMCTKYGLEDTNPLDDSSKKERRFSSTMMDSSEGKVNIHQDTDDTHGFPPLVYRSVSLPSFVSTQDEYSGQDPHYIPMTSIYPECNQNFLLQPTRQCSLSESNVYVYMKFGENAENSLDVAKRGLSQSQQELVEMMHTYKKGDATISNVEAQFKDWQKKYRDSNSSCYDDQGETTQHPYPAPESRMYPRKKKRIRRSKQQESSTHTTMAMERNSVNYSTSSASSKTSETSNCTVQSFSIAGSKKSACELITEWIPGLETVPPCPLNPGADPPPLPTGPRPPTVNEPPLLLRKKSARRKTGTYKPPVHVDLSNKTSCEYDEAVKSLVKVCERYGLQHLGDYFISGCSDNTETVEDSSPKTDESEAIKEERYNLSNTEWDQDALPSLQRSLSLPSTLFPIESTLQRNLDSNDDVQYLDDFSDCRFCKCEDNANSLASGIYTSIVQGKPNSLQEKHGHSMEALSPSIENSSSASGIYMSLLPSQPMENEKSKSTLCNLTVSKSQEELLELMEAFKKGDRTISDVENEFVLWHHRQMTKPSTRDEHLMYLKNQYERAQKPQKIKIKELILGKTKSSKKDSKKSFDDTEKNIKKREEKRVSDSRRLSKISSTSGSSGISDHCEVFKYCYDNPAYGETNEMQIGNSSSKPSCLSHERIQPPPLPPRPSLTAVATLRSTDSDRQVKNNDACEREKIPEKSRSESPLPVKKKPSPPPKPPNVYKKLSETNSTENGSNNAAKREDGQESENADIRPESPVYVIPNTVHQAARKKRPSPPCPVCPIHSKRTPLNSETTKSASCSSTIVRRKDSPKKSIPNQLVGIATHLIRPKKPDEAMFYVKRKWSSSPKLNSAEMPIYLDLQELSENKVRSISENNDPED